MSESVTKSRQEFNDEVRFGQKDAKSASLDAALQEKNDAVRFGARVDEKGGPNQNQAFNDRVRYGAKDKS